MWTVSTRQWLGLWWGRANGLRRPTIWGHLQFEVTSGGSWSYTVSDDGYLPRSDRGRDQGSSELMWGIFGTWGWQLLVLEWREDRDDVKVWACTAGSQALLPWVSEPSEGRDAFCRRHTSNIHWRCLTNQLVWWICLSGDIWTGNNDVRGVACMQKSNAFVMRVPGGSWVKWGLIILSWDSQPWGGSEEKRGLRWRVKQPEK